MGSEGLKVRCRSCGRTDLYQTTEAYDPNIPLTGDMLRLQKPYSIFNWDVYDGALGSKSTSRFLMLCVKCGGYITTDGKLDFVDKKKSVNGAGESLTEIASDFICPECGKICGSKAGLGAHMRVHKTE